MNTEQKRIGSICNYYGFLSVKSEDGKFYWSIENWDGEKWEEIPEKLYAALLSFDKAREKKMKNTKPVS